MRILLLTPAPANSLHFANSLAAECGGPLLRAGECAEALQKVSSHKPGLVIVDEHLRDGTALEFIRQLVNLNAFVNVAVMSGLPEDRFHEAYEGLGVLAQLPPRPGRREAADLLAKYRQVALPA
jgi:CheY-like chemotaxis protein